MLSDGIQQTRTQKSNQRVPQRRSEKRTATSLSQSGKAFMRGREFATSKYTFWVNQNIFQKYKFKFKFVFNLQVVWHEMEYEFIAQYNSIENMITKCYPDSGILLDFKREDILQFFSEIAQEH